MFADRPARAQRLPARIAPLALAVLLVAHGPAALAGQPSDTARSADVDAIFAKWNRPGSPGASVVVVRGGEIVYEQGYGMADLDHDLPITPRTVFDIASVSKQFTAFAVALLAEEGALSLDDPVRKWVPELPASVYDPVTLRHLVHHTSGVRDWVELLWLAGWRFDDVIGIPDILELAMRQRALNFAPGSAERYSNTGYNLLALVVGRATGGTFREFMEERVFGPLGMVYTHVHALAKWLHPLQDGTIGGAAVARTVRERFRLSDGEIIDYAFGLSHGEFRGLPTLGHGGSWRGFRTHLLTFPGQDLGIAVLGNSTEFDAGGSAHRVAEVYLRDALEPASVEQPDPRAEPETRSLPAARLADYVGRWYSDELGAVWELSGEDGHLRVSLWTHEPWLVHALADEGAADVFTADGIRGRQTYRFERDADGGVNSFTVEGARFDGVRFVRLTQGQP